MASGPRPLALALAMGVLVAPALLAGAQAEETDAARVAHALAFVAASQLPDGTWDLPSQGYVVELAATAGEDPKRWPTPVRSAFAALHPAPPGGGMPDEQADRVYKSILRIAHAAGAAGYDPRGVNGRDLVARVREGFVGGQSGDPRYVNDDAFAILALRAAGIPTTDPQIRAAVDALRRARAADGGWGHLSLNAGGGDVDSTGMVLAALRAAGERLQGDEAAVFLAQHRDADTGGYRAKVGGRANCQSTVWAIHARSALGLPAEPAALGFLRNLQTDEGGFRRTLDPRDTRADTFCTVEAALALAGGRFPLPSYAPPTGAPPAVHALARVAPSLPGPYWRHVWTWSEGDVQDHGDGTFTFPRAGAYAYRVLSEGDGTRHRGEGTLVVLSARPLLDARLSATNVHRHAILTLDATRSSDPDGRVARLVVDWGDGHVETTASLRAQHAYALPGVFEVRAHVEDEMGHASGAFTATVRVHNRAPVLPPLPERLVADRAHPARLPWSATDPDGDPVAMAWRVENRTGATQDVPFDALGNHTVWLVAEDPHGGRVEASLPVEVVNLPPSLSNLRLPDAPRAGEAFAFSVEARDKDGPTPRVAWTVGNLTLEGPAGNATLPAGVHVVTVVATDADGAERRLQASLVVDAPEPVVLPEVRNLSASLEAGVLRVSFAPPPPGASALVAWESDAGAGEVEAPEGVAEVPLPSATEARVRVTVRLGPLVASAEAGPLRAPAPAPPAPEAEPQPQPIMAPASEQAPTAETPPPAPSPEDARADPGPAPDDRAPEEIVLTPAPQAPLPAEEAPPRREAPAPSLLAALAATLLLPRRGRRAP